MRYADHHPIAFNPKSFMFKPALQILPLIVLLLLSCKSERKYPYAIKDFRKSLQPQLAKIVSEGVVTFDTLLNKMATGSEWVQLSQCEHPVLRASALKVLLYRDHLKPFDILMNHLDDTANVVTDQGEFGFGRMTVSDDMLSSFRWNSQEQRNKTIDAVLSRHNYLASAYTILSEIKPQEKWYPFIKDMAFGGKNNNSQIKLYESNTDEALYALAEFKKKEDIPLIKNLLLSDTKYLSFSEWRLMKDIPDTAYLSVYEAYYPKYYYTMNCRDGGKENVVDFIYSIATYKNNRSANILDSIYNHIPFAACPKDGGAGYTRHNLISAIVNNECIAYAKLRQQIENGIPGFDKSKFQLPGDNFFKYGRSEMDRDIPW